MSAQEFLRLRAAPAAIKLPRLSRDFLCRVVLVTIFVTLTHQFRWGWLRFLTSEAILRISAFLGMPALRTSLDTIYLNGQLNQFVTACTFIDVYAGSMPLLWSLQNSLLRNVSKLIAVGAIFFAFNILRLEIAQILYPRGVPWILADEVLGGFAYFAVWLFIWRQRSWQLIVS